MPAKSKKQQMAAGAALAAKSMSKAELRRMAKTKRKGKPTRKKRR